MKSRKADLGEGSSEEPSPIVGFFYGRINNYLGYCRILSRIIWKID